MKNCANCSGITYNIWNLPIDYSDYNKVTIDACDSCRLMWFDANEESLSRQWIFMVVEKILEQEKLASNYIQKTLLCPICNKELYKFDDMYSANRCSYYLCNNEHGMLISYADFLRFKWIDMSSLGDLEKARKFWSNCKQCGSSLSMETKGICSYCHTNNLEVNYSPEELKNIKEWMEKLVSEIQEDNILYWDKNSFISPVAVSEKNKETSSVSDSFLFKMFDNPKTFFSALFYIIVAIVVIVALISKSRFYY